MIIVTCLMMYCSLKTASSGGEMMKNNTIIICGLTEWEKEMMKDKGKCRACMYNDSYFDRKEHVQFCGKTHQRLKSEKTDCQDWQLDTR